MNPLSGPLKIFAMTLILYFFPGASPIFFVVSDVNYLWYLFVLMTSAFITQRD
jgi:hypothetical protein